MVAKRRRAQDASTQNVEAIDVSERRYGLLISSEAGVESHVLMDPKPLLLGRGEECDVPIVDGSVSRKHAVLHHAPPEPPAIEDLGSRNGTWVGGRRLAPRQPHPVGVGTVIELGSATVVLQRGSAALAGPPRQASQREHDAVLRDPTMVRLYKLIDLVAPSQSSVLLLGETGVGKEIFAETIHQRSARSAGKFVRVNCAALSESLLESELFGHEKGAFTGAVAARAGLFEAADGGTVFLDEVGELPLVTQAKLLRVLEKREIVRLGSVTERHVDVRFVTATNRDLKARVAEGHFRADLFFRLNGIAITIPPLRRRRDEIVPLAERFADEATTASARGPLVLTDAARQWLVKQRWPGNVRELKNTVQRAVLLCEGVSIDVSHLETEFDLAPNSVPGAHSSREPREPGDAQHTAGDAERSRIEAALHACAGNQTRAAEMLGLSRSGLLKKVARFGLKRPRTAHARRD